MKEEILRRMKEEGISVSQASAEHGVTAHTVYKWLGASAKAAPTWSEFAVLSAMKKSFSVLSEN